MLVVECNLTVGAGEFLNSSGSEQVCASSFPNLRLTVETIWTAHQLVRQSVFQHLLAHPHQHSDDLWSEKHDMFFTQLRQRENWWFRHQQDATAKDLRSHGGHLFNIKFVCVCVRLMLFATEIIMSASYNFKDNWMLWVLGKKKGQPSLASNHGDSKMSLCNSGSATHWLAIHRMKCSNQNVWF